MSRAFIVGAGDFGGEVAAWILDSPESLKGKLLAGFLDDSESTEPIPGIQVPVVGTIREYRPQPGDALIVGLSDPTIKERVCSQLETLGGTFVSFVHRSAIVAQGAKVGRGSVLCPGVVVSVGAEVGEFATLNLHATIGHHVKLGPYCSIMSHGDVMGHAQLGPRVLVGSRGGVLPRVKVGADAIVGAGSTAMRHVLTRTTVLGVPAKRLGAQLE
jgi:sugar O-acyltransferase (sialic acid O-acetyltransferase NeuD family)